MARLAIAKKDINTGRFTVKSGEPLPEKYQLWNVWQWIKDKFGSDSIEIINEPKRSKLYSVVYERQMREIREEFDMVSTHRDELTARLNELEKKLNSKTGSNAGMKERNGNSQG